MQENIYNRLQIRKIENEISNESLPDYLINQILTSVNVLIVCGEGLSEKELNHLIKFAEKFQIPVFADVLSNLRFKFESKFILCHYENYLIELSNVGLIIRFGKKPNSKALNELLDSHKEIVHLFDPIGRFNDDTQHVHSHSILEFPLTGEKLAQQDFNQKLTIAEDKNNSNLNHYVFKLLKFIPKNSQLFIGNSLPIREFDKIASNYKKEITILGNRGASGIDGIISSAIGMAMAKPKKQTILVIGDVSFFYDMSALQLAKNLNVNLTIFVINNGGGQIFNKLPYANYGIKDFEKFWLTNPNLNIEKTADLFGFHFLRIDDLEKFEDLPNYKLQIKEVIIS